VDDLRFIFYSHDGLGLGHIRRNLALAAAVVETAPEASVLVVTGSEEVGRLGVPPNVDVVKLPGLRKLANECYAPRRLPGSDADVLALRSAQYVAAVESFRPRVMLVDKHPLGAGGELRRALGILKAAGGHAALGLRDVLDEPATVRAEWSAGGIREAIEAFYERLLVYGTPSAVDLIDAYGLPPGALRRVRHTGYVMHPRPDLGAGVEELPQFLFDRRSRPLVLATAGGGQDGYRLLRTFVASARGAPWDAVVVAGPESPADERHSLRRIAAGAGVRYLTATADLPHALEQLDALVCMGGYNSLVEAVSSGTPTVCVPRVEPRSEQLIRARAFARLGLIRLLEPGLLDPARLRREVAIALRSSRSALAARAEATLDLDGARRAAQCLLELACEPRSEAPPRAGSNRVPASR
jgi:predicted glycosyltransferase